MKYFTSTDLAYLNHLNSLGIPPGIVTSRWVNITKHPVLNEWAACIPEDYLPRLGEFLGSEAATVGAGLKDYPEMEADGWVVERE